MLASTSFILATNLIGWMSNSDLNVELFWINIGYLGLVTLPVGWFSFALILAGYERWFNRRRVALLLVIPALMFGVVMTGGLYKAVWYVPQDGSLARLIDFSDWLIVLAGYTYFLLVSGTIMMLHSLLRATFLRRYQAAALIVVMVIPLVFNVLYVTHALPIPYDLTPLTYAFSGVVLTLGVMRFRVIDLTPIARSAMAEQIRDGILAVDLSGCVADLNPAARQFLGLGASSGLGSPLVDLLPALQDCLREDAPVHCEFFLVADGRSVDLEATITPLFINQQVPAGRLIVLHDITARKQTETNLQAALQQQRELNEMKARFYAYFAHQLRTPLSVVLSSTELLEYYGNDWNSEKRRVHFQRIYQSVHHLTDLSEQAAAFEKNERNFQEGENPPRPVCFDPQEFVARLIEQAQSADGNCHPVHLETQVPVLPVTQDAALLHDVLENVLSNALKFSPVGSPVQVTLETAPQQLTIRVQDFGCGIPADELSHVTQPFYRASNAVTVPGSGLGLAIASHYIVRLGGHLQVESQVNLGTTVQISVPLELAR
jgi:PAS domain S-box-containing protein